MRVNNKQGGIWTILIIVLLVIIVIGFFVPRNSFTPTETKKKNSFGQFTPRSSSSEGATPGPLKWKKSFVYEKENNSSNKGQSYMQYMMDKNKK